MNLLIIATSKKPASFEEEIKKGLRYRIEYLQLCDYLNASFVDYDTPGMHENQTIRSIEEKIHLDFYWARHITKLVKEKGYDVIISMSERIAVPLGLVLPPHVKHIAILLNALSSKWLSLIRISKVYQRWDKIITNSYAEADALKDKLKLDPEQITTIHNSIDLEFYNPTVVASSQTSERFMMSQGLSKRDYPTLIRALSTLPHVICHISAVSAWDDFKAGYEGLEIPENVKMKAYDHPYAIRNAMANCQSLIIPLKTGIGMWCAGSTSVLEAQAMGKPVIVTNLPGISEYVKDKETGFLVDGNDPVMLAEKIDFIWRKSNEAEMMGANAEVWVKENFSRTNWLNKMTELVREVSKT